jgi:hypothetical protein
LTRTIRCETISGPRPRPTMTSSLVNLSSFIYFLFNFNFRSCNQTIYRTRVFAAPKFGVSAGGGFRAVRVRCNLAPPVEISSASCTVTAQSTLHSTKISRGCWRCSQRSTPLSVLPRRLLRLPSGGEGRREERSKGRFLDSLGAKVQKNHNGRMYLRTSRFLFVEILKI